MTISQRPSDDLLGPETPTDTDDDAPSRGSASGGDDGPQRGTPDEDIDALRERTRKQRQENLRLNRRLQELEGQHQQTATVEERAKSAEADRDRYQQELREERAARTIMATATRAGAVDVEDVADILIRRNMVEFDDEGHPKDIVAAIEELKRSKPHLFSTRRVPESDAGRGNGRRGEGEQKNDWNTAFRRSAQK